MEHVNAPQTDGELAGLRQSIHRGRPYGDGEWLDETVARLNLSSTLRPRGRPRKGE